MHIFIYTFIQISKIFKTHPISMLYKCNIQTFNSDIIIPYSYALINVT